MKTHNDELSAVHQILKIEKELESEKRVFRNCQNAKFEKKPEKPTREIINKIVPNVPENPMKVYKVVAFGPFVFFLILLFIVTPFTHGNHIIATFILTILSFFWMIGHGVFILGQDRNYRNKYRKTDEWRNRCNEADIERQRKQNEADDIYRRKVKEYENTILPQWEERYHKWKETNENCMSKSASNINVLEQNREGAYRCFTQIPLEYRNLTAIKFIYDTMSFTNCSLQYAIDSYTDKLEKDEEDRRQKELQRQKYDEYYERRRAQHEVRDEFLKRTAATAAGVYVGNKILNKNKKSK